MRTSADVEAAQELRVAIGRVARRLRRLYAAERESAASFIELAILVHLDREGPAFPSALATRESVTSQAIAGIVRDLEHRGLVGRARDPDDGRRVLVGITPAGRKLLVRRGHAVDDAIASVLANEYTPAERRRLESAVPLLGRLAERL